VNLKVKNNIKKNRLYFTFSGTPTREEMGKLYTDVIFNVSDLKHGFDVISDFSECKLVQLNGINTFIKIMNYLLVSGVGEIVRVINKNSLLFTQIRNLSLRIYGYKVNYVSSLDEAERKLESSIKRNGIRLNVNCMPVSYIVNELNIKGNLLNLSTSGCAIESDKIVGVSIGEIIPIIIEFKNENISNGEFKVKGEVVRTDDNSFAVRFNDFDKDEKDRLWKCLIRECQSEL
jgi:hypothetical protein